MAIKTVTGRKILFKIAEDTDNIKSAYVTSNGSTTSVTCAGVDEDANAYQYAIGRILGKGDCLISSHTDAGVFTVATLSSSPATNDVFQWAWWVGNKIGDAVSAMNEAIRYSWPFWYREAQTGVSLTGTVAKTSSSATLTGTSTKFLTEVNIGDYITVPGTSNETKEVTAIASDTSLTVASAYSNSASGQTATLASNITFATGTYRYALPPSCDALLAIGIQPTGKPIEWLEYGDDSDLYWKVVGQSGNYSLVFNPRFSREGAIPDVYNGEVPILWYAVREPELTDLTTSSCQLPLDYFIVGATAFSIRNLQTSSKVDLITANVAIPQLQEQSRVILQSLGIAKRPPNRVLNPDARIPDYKFNSAMTQQGDGSNRTKRFAMQEQDNG